MVNCEVYGHLSSSIFFYIESLLVCCSCLFIFRCGPCKVIAPHFDELSQKYPGAKFLKVDVDECERGLYQLIFLHYSEFQ